MVCLVHGEGLGLNGRRAPAAAAHRMILPIDGNREPKRTAEANGVSVFQGDVSVLSAYPRGAASCVSRAASRTRCRRRAVSPPMSDSPGRTIENATGAVSSRKPSPSLATRT